jgi:hypothetical protein
LISGDQLLSDFVNSHIDGFSNVQVFDGLEALKGLISTLSSEVDEEFVDELQKKASALFFVNAQSKETLYYRENISEQIKSIFSNELSAIPEGATSKVDDGIFITPPRFVRKEKQRVYWSSRITFNFNAMRWVSSVPQIGSGMFGSSAIPPPTVNALRSTLLTSGSTLPTTEVAFTGKTHFDINCSTTVNNKKMLSHPSIDLIDFVETTLQQK